MDLSWAAGTMPATASLEILWSKASFEGNWLIQPAQLGDIDTSHVASTDNSGGGETPTDLVANGAFDDATGWTGAGVNAVDGVNRVNNDTVAANSYDVNMQTTVDLEPGNTYTLTFEARGEAGRLFDVGIGDSAAPYGTDKKSLEVDTDWQTYTLHLNSNTLGTGEHRVFLDFGHDTGLFEIDNVSLVAGHVGTEALNLPADDNSDGGSDGPQAAAPTLVLDADDIDVYVAADAANGDSQGALTDANPDWGQSGSGATIAHPVAGPSVIHIQNDGTNNYQGMDIASTDVSGKTSMHIDLWSETSGSTKLFLIGNGEAGIVLDVVGGQWNSFDIDLVAFAPATESPIVQMKFAGNDATATPTPLTDYYVDNLFFSDRVPTIGTPPSDPTTAAFLAGAVVPEADTADVVSLFSDAYATSVMEGGTFRTGWSNAGAVEELTIDNDNVIKKYNEVGFVGIEASTTYDVSQMGSLKFSIWRTEDSDLLLKVRDFGPNGGYDSAGDDAEGILTIPASDMPKDQWVTVEIPMSELVTAGLATNANVAQLVLDPATNETFYIDDIYWVASGDTGGGDTPTDLVANGAFDDATGWTGAGVNAVDGVNRVNNDTVAANSYDVNMQTTVDLEPGNTYTLTFEARGEAGRLFDVGIGDSAAPYGTDKKSLEVDTDWQTYTLHLNSNTLGTGEHRVFLDFGHDTGLFEIDNVSLVAGHVGTEALNLPADDNSGGGDTPTDLVANGAFDDATGWTGAGVNAVDGVNRVNNDTVAANSYDVNMQTTVDLEPGNTYTLTFEARGEAGRLFDVGIGDSAAPYGTDKKSLEVDTDWQTYASPELKYLGYW